MELDNAQRLGAILNVTNKVLAERPAPDDARTVRQRAMHMRLYGHLAGTFPELAAEHAGWPVRELLVAWGAEVSAAFPETGVPHVYVRRLVYARLAAVVAFHEVLVEAGATHFRQERGHYARPGEHAGELPVDVTAPYTGFVNIGSTTTNVWIDRPDGALVAVPPAGYVLAPTFVHTAAEQDVTGFFFAFSTGKASVPPGLAGTFDDEAVAWHNTREFVSVLALPPPPPAVPEPGWRPDPVGWSS